ncbi:hypothetical protein QYM36_005312, partial [Artemia franciscana]
SIIPALITETVFEFTFALGYCLGFIHENFELGEQITGVFKAFIKLNENVVDHSQEQ